MSDKTNPPQYIAPVLDLSNGSRYVPPESEIGNRIKTRRKTLDLTVDELAALTALFDHEAKYAEGSGISRATLYSYESKGTKPGTRELRILCEALNISPSFLIFGEEWDRELDYQAKLGKLFKELIHEANLSSLTRPSNDARNHDHFIKLGMVRKQKK